MDQLYPIIRRQRRPFVVPDAPLATPPLTPPQPEPEPPVAIVPLVEPVPTAPPVKRKK